MNASARVRVLCFTDTNSGRDVEMLLPLRYFAERYLNCEFRHAISFDPWQISRWKPDIIITPNTTGSQLYYRLARRARELHIPVFSMISEGNFRTDGSYDYWGYNTERRFMQEYVCCWSQRTRDYLAGRHPEAEEKIVVTGNAGSDRFVIYEPVAKETFLKHYRLPQFRAVIGYAAWTFNKLRFPRGRREIREFFGDDDSIFAWIEEQRMLVNGILQEAVRNNPDVLFILKMHPQDVSPELVQQPVNELAGLSACRNVLIVGEEESLLDLIGICDLWTCFESTTALEAWLMGKPTLFLNPDPDFKRADLVSGSPVASTAGAFQRYIDRAGRRDGIPEFASQEKAAQRETLIRGSVGYADGLNHVRASFYLGQVLKRLPSSCGARPRATFIEWLYHLFIVVGGTFYVRSIYRRLYKLKKHLWVFENYRMEGIEILFSRYAAMLERFYAEQKVEDRYRAGTLYDSILADRQMKIG